MPDDKDDDFKIDFSDNSEVKEPETPAEDKSAEETPKEEKKEDEPAKPTEEPKTPEAPEKPEEKPAEDVKPAEPSQPLTKDDVRTVISDLRHEERTSVREIEDTTKDVLEKYYPKGLSNVLIDEASGKELKTPQDVVDASGDSMSIEEASQWLMNEQYKLDKQVTEIKDQARGIAETTLKFENDGKAILERYDPLFKAYPQIQKKAFDSYMKLVERDDEKGVILKAPDMQEYYDTLLEPYRLAFEHSKQQSATQPIEEDKKPEPPKPSAEDRMDESGDGGISEVDDPNNFSQQVKKELAKGI